MPSLAEPLARALVRIGGKTMPHMDTWAVPVLAVLRNDPATLAALAEALAPLLPQHQEGSDGYPYQSSHKTWTVYDWVTPDALAERLADALFGAKP